MVSSALVYTGSPSLRQISDCISSPLLRVFVNRSLAMEKIKCFGFDMDYTLAGKRRHVFPFWPYRVSVSLESDLDPATQVCPHGTAVRWILQGLEQMGGGVFTRFALLNRVQNAYIAPPCNYRAVYVIGYRSVFRMPKQKNCAHPQP